MRPKRQANKQQEIEATDEDTDNADDATSHIWGTLHNQTDANQALHKCLNIISHYNKSEIVKSVSFGYYGQDNIVIYSLAQPLTHQWMTYLLIPEHNRATFGISDNQSKWWGDFKWPIQRPVKRQWQEKNWRSHWHYCCHIVECKEWYFLRKKLSSKSTEYLIDSH